MSKDQEKHDSDNYSRNFTRTPNIVFASYKHLSHEEKFLYNSLKYVYWDAKPRFASLRDISRLTGYVISALSRMLPRLHKCGLIHAEIMQEYNPDGTKKGKPKYYITIPDIWELNRRYFECSPEERFDPSDVLLENENVPLKNDNVLDENVNVLLEVRKRSRQEHKSGTETRLEARSQLPKESKDIFKDSKKEEPSSPVIFSSFHVATTTIGEIDNLEKTLADYTESELKKLSEMQLHALLSSKQKEILQRWRSLFKAPVKLDAKLARALHDLEPYDPSAETLEAIRRYCFSIDKPSDKFPKGYYKTRAVRLWDIVERYADWQQTQEPPPEQPKPSQQERPSLAERNAEKMRYAGITGK